MRENEKEREELKASRPKALLIKKKILLQCLSGAFIAIPPLQNTKKPKPKAITGGKMGRKPKSDKKKSKSQKTA